MIDSRSPTWAPNVVVSASIAFDYIMSFPGSIRDHILPDKVHVLSVSFLYDSMRRLRGGIAGNIAYNLALLGEPSTLVGGVGPDFGDYRDAFERLGIDLSLLVETPDLMTGSSFMTTDREGNQIAGFFPGASVIANDISVEEAARSARLGLVGATTLEAMHKHATEIAACGCPLIYDPSQQVVALPADDLIAGIDLAWAIVGSDYEFAIIEQKTGLTIDAIAERVPLTVVTYGAYGSEHRYQGERYKIPAVPADPVADPTGGGDAYRAGLIKGILLRLEWPVVGALAALSATYAVEHHGTQEHSHTPESFIARFDRAFPHFAGALTVDALSRPAPAVDSARLIPTQ
jgi:adenosine kinase